MTNSPKAAAPRFRRQNSCPEGWLHAGAKVPIHLTVSRTRGQTGLAMRPPQTRRPPRLQWVTVNTAGCTRP